jgi:hypothetical protein
MSVFSRLFQKNQEPGEQDPSKKGTAPEANAEDAPAPEAAKPPKPPREPGSSSSAAGRGSMRPKAPSFQLPGEPSGRSPLDEAAADPRARAASSAAPPQEQKPRPQPHVGSQTLKGPLVAPKPPPPPPSASTKPAPTSRSGGAPESRAAPPTVKFASPVSPAAAREAPAKPAPAKEAPAKPPPAKPAEPAAPPDIERLAVSEEVDSAFGSLQDRTSRKTQPEINAEVDAPPPVEVRELFVTLAANYMRQVRDFMIGIKWGEPVSDLMNICGPAVGLLMRAAGELQLLPLQKALTDFADALKAAGADAAVIDGAARDRLLAAYEKLSLEMPEAFELDREQNRREAVIVHSLLLQVPDVRKLTIDKLYAAGLTNLDMMFVAKADELSMTAGIDKNVASRIVERFRKYRAEVHATEAEGTRAADHQRLLRLCSELRTLHEQFEQIADAWSEEAHAKKKQLRQARSDALLQIKVLLARLGEVDRVGEVERLPFFLKIESLERYALETKATKAQRPGDPSRS